MMGLRSCGNTHFIQAIRGGLVIKVRNTHSHGRPALSFKTLKDVYEGKNAKTRQQPPTINSDCVYTGPAFDHEHVKCEVPCLPVEDRTLRELKPKTDEYVQNSKCDLDSDLDDDTTLRQLKERFQEKKRKFSHSDENSNLPFDNEKPVEDESDLNVPIINLKLKNSRKLKAKRKRMKGSVVSSSTTVFDIKSEPDLVSEDSPQIGGKLAPVIHVKVEVPAAEELGCQREPSADDSCIGCNEVPSPGDGASSGFQKMKVQLDVREPLLSAEECLKCVTNEISYDHLEDAEPVSMLLPSDGVSVKLEPLELHCLEFLDLPPLVQKGKEIMEAHSCRSSPSDDQNTDGCKLFRSSSGMEEESDQSSNSVVRVPDVAIECSTGYVGPLQEFDIVHSGDKSKPKFSHEQDSSLNMPDKNCCNSQNSITSFKSGDNLISTEDIIADEEEPLTCTLNDVIKSGLHWGSMEDELLRIEEKQASTSPILDAENQSSPENQTFDSADTISTSEPHQPPERLLSTRKAICPSSQERLCLAMNSVELSDDVDKYECKGLLFEKQTGKKASTIRSDIQHAKKTVNRGGHGQVSQRKVIISSRSVIKKSQNTKVNLEGPYFSHTLPNPSTGCASIQSCSENAIAFSQRQMQDMESLAGKLMNELKSMKDIVEQKLLFEAYRNVSLKSDAEEIKSAISSATRMEETTRKWLSTMARDCTRFCKIMELTPARVDASKDTVPRERKKIRFADEAGGKLCHVKFF